MTTDLIVCAVTVLTLTGAALRLQPQWTQRDITATGGYRATLIAAAALALLTGAAASAALATAPAAAVTAAAWLGALAISTDLSSRKIPREIPHVAAAIGLLAFASDATRFGAYSLAAATLALVALPWVARALTRQGLGFSDIRLLWAFAATLSWWTGHNVLLWGLIAACATQLLVNALARLLGFGRRVPVPDRDGNPTSRTRLELPFAPALVTGTAAATGWAVHTGITACTTWATTALC